MLLMGINTYQVAHPVIMWGAFKDWDFKTPFDEKPLFYEGVDDPTGEKLTKVQDEILDIARYLEVNHKLHLKGMMSFKDFFLECYEDSIADKSTMGSMIRTNKGYKGLTHPMIETPDGKFLPNFKSRYLYEEVPEGLAVTKGIAELCGLQTPEIDELMKFASKATGLQFLAEDGRLAGAPDLAMTRSPQALGISSIEDLIKSLNYH